MASDITGPCWNTANQCAPIFRALPDWFGIEEATRQYLIDIETRPTFLADTKGQTVGFLTLTLHNHFSAEVHVMGVLPAFHRQGIGRQLLFAAETWLMNNQIEYLQVKTLSAAHPDPGYSRTRTFYQRMGFRPLQEFPDLWGAENPCLQMVKILRR